MAKILVADDNSNIQKMVGLALKDQGIDVVAVGNGEAAVRKISDIKPDLVLADVFMPVRNGYEVCRYVKEDSALAHIPVILLVGAFDPLDEQEAQRVGADGVLKKPFVPPDPLISMVKSALTRAGISIRPAPVAEKTPPVPKRAADLLTGGVTSKLAALSPEKLPEAAPEPVEDFPVPAPSVRIAAGSEPLAFGSLLDTSNAEADELAITSKPMIELSQERKWDDESDDVPEEKQEEEESPVAGWHPEGLDKEVSGVHDSSQAAPDWREQAFHGNSPAKSFASHWVPAIEQAEQVEAAGSPSIAVATVETKPADSPAPFSGDAWAAAMAAGVEEKIGQLKDLAPSETEAEPAQEVHSEFAQQQTPEVAAPVQDAASVEARATENVHPEPSLEPANWAAVPETAWEIEAKKASLLASTWDAPKTYSVEETQEVPVYSAETPVEHAELPAENPSAEPSPYSAEPAVASETEAETEQHIAAAPSEPATEISSQVAEPQAWENTWESPAAPAPEPVSEEVQAESPYVEEPAPAPSEFAVAEAPTKEQAATQSPEAEPAEPLPVPEHAAEPDMDEIISRVLGKMNPEVLQRVTREILKPVIEAIVRDEINSKKS